jgi:hypothetical protein
MLVAAAVSFMVPVCYESQATLKAMPVDESTRRVLNNLEQNVLNRESLISVIKVHNLYSRERSRMAFDDLLDKMKRKIHAYSMPLASSGNRDSLAFVVQFDYSDPVWRSR